MVFGILAPVIYGAMGFVFGAIGAWIYNLVAKWLGGIEIQPSRLDGCSAGPVRNATSLTGGVSLSGLAHNPRRHAELAKHLA